MVKNIAHRGGAGLCPENTLAAFRNASNPVYAVDMIEFDLQPTRDRKIIVMHDKTIDRTTNGEGRAPELDFNYIRGLDAGSWFDPRYLGERIPTLSETLECIPDSIELNVELKFIDEKDNWFEQSVYKILDSHGALDRSLITTRWPLSCDRLLEIDPDIDTTVLQKQRTEEEYIDLLVKKNLKFAQLRLHSMNQDFIERLHDNGIQAFIFFADEETKMLSFIKMGIDGILTNYPDRLERVMRSL
ncbi:MAG: glycerophosphodiester phosphodiesterase [Candidatus Hodarchaeales archaeon]